MSSFVQYFFLTPLIRNDESGVKEMQFFAYFKLNKILNKLLRYNDRFDVIKIKYNEI